MWKRWLTAVAVCNIGDRHCDPANPLDTSVDPRFPCQPDAMGNFGDTTSATGRMMDVNFQYQIETNTEAQVSFGAVYQVELALSNILANAFFECRRRRNLQDMSLESLTGISAFPVDRVFTGVPCALESTAPGCFSIGGGFTIYGEGDLSWVETVAYSVTENAMNEGALNAASPEIQRVRYVADGELVTNTPTGAPITAAPSLPPITEAPTSFPSTLAPTDVPTTLTPTALPTTLAPTTSPITVEPSTSPTILVVPTAVPTTKSPSTSPTTLSPTTAPAVQSRETSAPTILSRIVDDASSRSQFPWWYIAAAGGTVLLVVSGGSLLYARRRRNQQEEDPNDTADMEPQPQQPSEPASFLA